MEQFVVSANTVDAFKIRLDRFLINQEIRLESRYSHRKS